MFIKSTTLVRTLEYGLTVINNPAQVLVDENFNINEEYDVSVKKAVTLGYINTSLEQMFGFLARGIRGMVCSLPGRVWMISQGRV